MWVPGGGKNVWNLRGGGKNRVEPAWGREKTCGTLADL